MQSRYFVLLGLVICALFILFAGTAIADGKWKAQGMTVEGCSCIAPCTCELTGDVEMGCQGVGFTSLTAGNYMGVDLKGVKFAYATTPGEWVRVYVDAKDEKQKEAATAFAKNYYKGFGPVEAASAVKIDITGKDGKYTVKIDDGKICVLETEPILGGDGKNPLIYSNTKSKLGPVFMQAKTVSCTYHDGERKFELKGSNSYFNTKLKSEGTLE